MREHQGSRLGGASEAVGMGFDFVLPFPCFLSMVTSTVNFGLCQKTHMYKNVLYNRGCHAFFTDVQISLMIDDKRKKLMSLPRNVLLMYFLWVIRASVVCRHSYQKLAIQLHNIECIPLHTWKSKQHKPISKMFFDQHRLMHLTQNYQDFKTRLLKQGEN